MESEEEVGVEVEIIRDIEDIKVPLIDNIIGTWDFKKSINAKRNIDILEYKITLKDDGTYTDLVNIGHHSSESDGYWTYTKNIIDVEFRRFEVISYDKDKKTGIFKCVYNDVCPVLDDNDDKGVYIVDKL